MAQLRSEPLRGARGHHSEVQQTLAKDNYAGLPVDIHLPDYRDLNEQFDRIVLFGVFEYV
jgi:cyclopropane-fatty-acyl-phospholipid synthase